MSTEAAAESKSAKTVTIACKMPRGLILRLFKTKMVPVPVLGGGMREEPRAEPIPGKEVHVHGPARPFGADPVCTVVAGYALTTGVDIDFWKEWKEQNHDSDLLKNKIVFAYPTPESAGAAAKEHAKVKSGLEPLDMSMKTITGPDGNTRTIARDERVPRSPGLSIQKSDQAA